MSKSRKHVENEIFSSYPEPKENEFIVKVLESRGNNTLLVAHPSGETELCSIPAKFNKKVWIKRGSFIIIQLSKLPNATGKIHSIVSHTLFSDQIKHLNQINLWPNEFKAIEEKKTESVSYYDFPPSSDEEDEDEDEDQDEDDEDDDENEE